MDSKIKQMPKAVLHLHLDGSLRPETVYKWLREEGQDVTLEEVTKNLMVEKDCRDLNEYLQKFDLPVQVLQEKEHIEQATYELFEDLANQNVIYAEVRFAPSKHLEKGLKYEEVVQAAIDGMNRAKKDFGIEGNIILCCMRGDSQIRNLQTIKAASQFLNNGVCAVDLAGAEALFPTKDYIDIFNQAKRLNIPFTIHAGEADGPESIKKALEFGAKRIGHGVRCLEDKALIAELITKQIALEVCPISNLQTKATEEPHPIAEILKKGLLATISPDNNTVSNTDILQEYEYILNECGITIKDLIQMNKNAISAAFIPPQKKAELKAKIAQFEKEQENNLQK